MRDAGPPRLTPGGDSLARPVIMLAGLSLLATGGIAVARAAWFLELFTHFRVQLIALQLGLLLACLALRRRRWALSLALAGMLNAAPALDYLLPLGGALQAGSAFDGLGRADRPLDRLPTGSAARSSDGVPDAAVAASADGTAAAVSGDAVTSSADPGAVPASIRVLSANVLASNADAAAFIDVLRSSDPDVFAVIELTEAFVESLAGFAVRYPHRVLQPRPDPFGIGVYSRWPLENVELVRLEGTTAIDVQISAAGQPWRLLAAHLVPPMNAALAAQRNAQLAALAGHVRSLEVPHVVVGDFNLSPYSPWFGDFLDGSQLHSALQWRGPQLTWPSGFWPLGIPIDHVFVSREFTVSGYFRAGAIGSDHYPIVADLERRLVPLEAPQ